MIFHNLPGPFKELITFKIIIEFPGNLINLNLNMILSVIIIFILSLFNKKDVL